MKTLLLYAVWNLGFYLLWCKKLDAVCLISTTWVNCYWCKLSFCQCEKLINIIFSVFTLSLLAEIQLKHLKALAQNSSYRSGYIIIISHTLSHSLFYFQPTSLVLMEKQRGPMVFLGVNVTFGLIVPGSLTCLCMWFRKIQFIGVWFPMCFSTFWDFIRIWLLVLSYRCHHGISKVLFFERDRVVVGFSSLSHSWNLD